MLLKQDSFGCLAYASYLIADEATGTAVVADPQRAIEQCLHKTMQHSWHIDYVFLTHIHANFLAGHIELQSRVMHPVHPPKQRHDMEYHVLAINRQIEQKYRSWNC